MSYRSTLMSCEGQFAHLAEHVRSADFGSRHDDVTAALDVLHKALTDAHRAVQIAEQRSNIERANAVAKAARERIAELGGAT